MESCRPLVVHYVGVGVVYEQQFHDISVFEKIEIKKNSLYDGYQDILFTNLLVIKITLQEKITISILDICHAHTFATIGIF